MTNNILKVAVGAALFAAATAAVAQTGIRPAYYFPATPSGSGPASAQVGDTPVYFTPYLGAAVGRDDNLFLSNTNQKSSTLYIVSPGFKLDARDPNKVFQLAYQGQIGRYAQSEDDNYIDHTVRAQLDTAFDRRNFLKLGFDYLRTHDPRGSSDRTISARPDRYTLASPSITYAFGAPGAQGRAEVYYSEGRKRYLNNREVTISSDRITREGGGAFYFRVMPKTYLLGEVRRTDFSYRLPTSPFNSEETRYYGGVSWEATAATTGTVKVGRLEKKFDSDSPKFTGTSWEAIVTWTPRTYSKFDFYATRTTSESTGIGDFILSDIAGLTWTHAWSSVLNTGVDARYQRDQYKGFDRSDDIKSLGLKVGYKFRRWLTFGAEYTYTQRDSNQSVFEYDKNLYMLTATASM
ncbi:MAG: outer membrane beta-barrel protein [Pseudomonadota bacterium]|nr:outer membrane beta-barrel protein [Pseudomonadota bacterium]